MHKTGATTTQNGDGAPAPDAARLPALADAARCVHCGLCLPHCPTYRLSRHEAESPRGRLALMDGIGRGALRCDAAASAHLDNCLHCGHCEAVCPARVPFKRLMDAARQALPSDARLPLWLRALAVSPAARGLARAALGVYRRGGLGRLARLGDGAGRFAQLDAMLPRAPAPRLRAARDAGVASDNVASSIASNATPEAAFDAAPEAASSGMPGAASGATLNSTLGAASGDAPDAAPNITPGATPAAASGDAPDTAPNITPGAALSAESRAAPSAVLFVGCMHDVLDRGAVAACAALLAAAGRPVALSAAQGCCGALHRHAGMPARADALVARNRRALAGRGVISCASGCGAECVEQGLACEDVHAALLARADRLRFKPLPATVALHTPCTMRNAFDPAAPRRLLERVPGLRVAPLGRDRDCCGAAGAFMLRRPRAARALGAELAAALQNSGAQCLATTNLGCALHFKRMLRAAGATTEVLHPAQLLHRQLAKPPAY